MTTPTIDRFVLTVARSDASSADVAVEASSGPSSGACSGTAVGRIPAVKPLQALCASLVGRPLLDQSARWRSHAEAPGYGLAECALADLAARIAGVPLSLWLGGTANETLALAVTVADVDAAPAARDASMVVLRARDWRNAATAVAALRARAGAPRDVAVDLGGSLTALDAASFDEAARRVGIDLVIDPSPDILTARRLGTPVALRVAPGGLTDVAAALEEDRAQAIVADPARWGPAGIARLAALCRVFQASLHVASATHPIATAFAAHIARSTQAATRIVLEGDLHAFATRETPGLGTGLALDGDAESGGAAQRIVVRTPGEDTP